MNTTDTAAEASDLAELTELKRKVEMRKSKPEMAKNMKALKADIAALEG